MKWEQLRTAKTGITLDWDEVKELIGDVLGRIVEAQAQGRENEWVRAHQLRVFRPKDTGKSYQHGFRDGWASALGKVSESVKRLGAGVQDAPEPPEPTNTQATHDDPWTHVASLRSAMQMLGKRVDEITLNQSDDTTKMSSLRQAHERLGELEGLHHEERIGALESVVNEVRGFDGSGIRRRIGELEEKLTGTILSNWGFVNGHDERIKALESLPGRVESLSNLQRDNTHMRVALANRVSELESGVRGRIGWSVLKDSIDEAHRRHDVLAKAFDTYRSDVDKQTNDALGDMERELRDLNTRLSQLDRRTVAALQIGGVANPL